MSGRSARNVTNQKRRRTEMTTFRKLPSTLLAIGCLLTTINNSSENSISATASFSPLSLRIVGGHDAPIDSVPYQVALYLKEEFYCSGVLLSQRTVLTAAQCIRGHEQTPHLFSIRYGSQVHSQGVRSVIIRLLPHPKFTPRQIEYDLAILHLAHPVIVSRHTFPAVLAEKSPLVGSSVQISGWGTVQPKGAFPRTLQVASTLKVVPIKDCRAKWGRLFDLSGGGIFCAESATQSACHWDSGGPVMQEERLVGVISFGAKRCLEQGTPNGYVDVSTHRHWIMEHLLE